MSNEDSYLDNDKNFGVLVVSEEKREMCVIDLDSVSFESMQHGFHDLVARARS